MQLLLMLTCNFDSLVLYNIQSEMSIICKVYSGIATFFITPNSHIRQKLICYVLNRVSTLICYAREFSPRFNALLNIYEILA